ncbi:hypothetical protein ONZ45_g8599 [Pleurotus djamor]|nr:hypothetical protein ONZ45_g8599 [Pleurotus djamor]
MRATRIETPQGASPLLNFNIARRAGDSLLTFHLLATDDDLNALLIAFNNADDHHYTASDAVTHSLSHKHILRRHHHFQRHHRTTHSKTLQQRAALNARTTLPPELSSNAS